MEYKQTNETNEPKQESIFTENEFSMEGYDKHIRQARNAIFWVAGILLLNLVILIATLPESYEYVWLDIAIWGVFILGFVFLGFYCKNKPYYAIIGALVLYGLFILLNAYIDVSTIYKGIIFKVIVIVFLIKGLKDAKEAQEMRKNFAQ